MMSYLLLILNKSRFFKGGDIVYLTKKFLTPQPKKYLHVKNVAARLDCSAKRVYMMIQDGELEAIRISVIE